jgi:adenylate cyclase
LKPGTRIVAAGLVVLAGMVGLFSIRPVFLDRLELSLLDWRFRLRGVAETTGRVALVTVDEKSVDVIGRWPWRRSVIADLVDRLSEAGVAAIGFDVVFSEAEIVPETETLRDLRRRVEAADGERFVPLVDRALARANTDAQLAESIARSNRTVLGYFFRTDEAEEVDPVALEATISGRPKAHAKVARVPGEGRAPILQCTSVEPNLPSFEAGARRLGFFSTLRDPDGVVRRTPLVVQCADTIHISLSLALAELVAKRPAIVLGNPEGIQQVRLGEIALPTDEGGKILVNFRGPPQTFPHYSAVDVLDGTVGRAELEDKVILIGATEIGIADLRPTPFATSFPGVEIHATVVDNLLTGNVLHRTDNLTALELAALILLGGVIALVVPRFRSFAQGAGLAIGLFGLYVVAVVYAFVVHGLWVNLTYPTLTLAGVYMAVAVTHGVTVEARARMIRRQFASYVPPEVVNEMVENPESLGLGGERRDCSILFSDVRGFTTLSEELGAENTTRLLNEYLTPMTRIVFESRGTLDKYIGDAVVAFWGAPLTVPEHPTRACESALRMQEETAHLRDTRPDLAGADRLRIGVGIHSAEVMVGKMGSELRFDYTMTGDGVNLCARLEGLTKFYGVEIIASHGLVSRSHGLLFRELDTIRVKGKRESVRIYEVVGREGMECPAWLETFAQGLAAYREGRWDEAEKGLREVLDLTGRKDGPSHTLLERIGTLRREPPPEWDGVWSFEEK